MKLLRQPNNKTCGQTTIAMLADISVEKSCELFGHMTTSYFKDYTRVLGLLGIAYQPWVKIDNRKKFELPNKGLLRIQYGKRKNGHLMAYCNGKIYDPLNGYFESKEKMITFYNFKYNAKVRMDWYMEILDNAENRQKSAGN